jgi:hypothetical protein
MQLISIPKYLAIHFGRSVSERRMLLKGWQRMHLANQQLQSGLNVDISEIQLPKKRTYSFRIYTAWSLLHIAAFNKAIFGFGMILIVPACLISILQLINFIFKQF